MPPRRPRLPRRGLRGAAALLIAALLGVGACSTEGAGLEPFDLGEVASTAPVAIAPPGTPNAVVVVVDDMNDWNCADTARFLPRSSPWLRDQGTCFENGSVTSPVCCPARGQLVTGQMPHNNGVERQVDARNIRVEDTIQHDLGQLGVATYGAGKYLNGVNATAYHSRFDTGFQDFDFWNGMDFWGYPMVDDEGHEYQPADGVHGTVRVGDLINDFVTEQARADRPFYAYAAFHAPHTQNALVNPTFREWLPSPTPANADRAVPRFRYQPEADTRDKLDLFHGGRLTRRQYERFWTERVRSLYDIDDQVARIFTTLETEGVLDETAVFFVSDNGYLLGQNGWEGKGVPYPDSVNVPVLAYLPGRFAPGAVDTRPVGLVDVAPTLYELFGIAPGHVLDGHSLLSPTGRRTEYFEFTNEKSRFVLKESGRSPMAVPSWRMIRRGDRSYVEFYNRKGALLAREFYEDPRMRRNLLYPAYRAQRPKGATLRWWRQELHRLATCAGQPGSGATNPCP